MTVVASGYARKENELYSTEPWATEAFLRHFPMFALNVWEAAAGNHHMADVLKARGANVWTSDIATYEREHDQIFDFLDPDRDDYEVVDAIVTNPPYGFQNKLAVTFARYALQRCHGWVALLLTAKFDSGSTRLDLFRDNPRFHCKIVLVDRISWEGNGETGTEDHAWYIWRPKYAPVRPPYLVYEGKNA